MLDGPAVSPRLFPSRRSVMALPPLQTVTATSEACGRRDVRKVLPVFPPEIETVQSTELPRSDQRTMLPAKPATHHVPA